MVKLVFCVRRNPAPTREDFQRYWLERHGRLVTSLRDADSAVLYTIEHAIF